MGNPLAVILGSVIIAAAILLAFRWNIIIAGPDGDVVRLDHWTGHLSACGELQHSVDPRCGDK